MKRGKAHGEDQVTADLLKDRGQIVLKKLPTLYTQCLMTSSVSGSCKKANSILNYQKVDVSELKNHRQIPLHSVAYKIF